MLAKKKSTDVQERHGLPFGYLLEHGADLPVPRRPDRPFEIEAAVLEDADRRRLGGQYPAPVGELVPIPCVGEMGKGGDEHQKVLA